MWINKEIPIWLAAATAFIKPAETMLVVNAVAWWVKEIIDKGSAFLWANAPLAHSIAAWLWWAKLTQFWLDKMWVESKYWRYPLITTWAFYAATSTAAPYFAAWAWVYYAWKYWYKLWKWVLSKAWNWLKSVGSALNPFKWKSA